MGYRWALSRVDEPAQSPCLIDCVLEKSCITSQLAAKQLDSVEQSHADVFKAHDLAEVLRC